MIALKRIAVYNAHIRSTVAIVPSRSSAAMAITIQRCVSITHGASPAWVVSVQEFDGMEFIPMSIADRSMFRFLFGRHDHVSIPMLDVLKHERTKASLKLGDPGDNADCLFNATTKAAAQAAAKASRQQCKTMQALGTLPSIVEVDFPAVGNIQGLKVKCVTSLDAKTVLRVELTTAVLTYVKAVFLQGHENGEPLAKRLKIKSAIKGVCWRSSNQAWIATRLNEDGSKKYMTFRPIDHSDAAIADAEELAAKWVEGNPENDEGRAEAPRQGSERQTDAEGHADGR